jgi:adenosylcobyric acid synthase
MKNISIFGTSSDAGKSTLSFAITYLLHKRGVRAVPFKAQNVSNNSVVCDDGGEIAIPQAFAAEAIGLRTTPLMNPILLKSGSKNKAHLIINGKSVKDTDVWSYYRAIDKLKPHAKKAFEKLQKKYECIVAEGAGSPVELNLMDKDLSNIFIANEFDTKIVLVADIERGGVFASIYGVYKLLPKKLQKNIVGVIVNKFRGDITLFDKGREIIEKRFNLKVLGVVPYKSFNLGFEDAQSLINYTQNTKKSIIKVGVIKFPHMSNFTDFEPLVADKEIELKFVTNLSELSTCHAIILPGTKRVVDDLKWLKKSGFAKAVKQTNKTVIAICGGYEMMFKHILDPLQIESYTKKTKALGIFKGDVTFKKKKKLKKGNYNIFELSINGYEIHNGYAKKIAIYKNNIYGTFIHAIFESDKLRYKIFSKINHNYKGYNFKKYKTKTIKSFTKHIDKHVDMSHIQKVLNG